MKAFFTAIFAIALYSITYAQGPVDTHARAKIYVNDPQSGQQMEATDDLAIQFKDAVIDLVRRTPRSHSMINGEGPVPANRWYTVTEMPADANINGYQVSFDEINDPSQPVNIYTFSFHVDDGTLYYYDPGTQQWDREVINVNNLRNLRLASSYGRKFNEEMAGTFSGDVNANAQVDLNAEVDADVVADSAPPALPEYEQPACPVEGYLWQPGYWGYSPYQNGYYWVTGAWVAPPTPGVFWTPPYWGYEGARFVFHVGYWGDHVGFYGGINYGYGYGGRGFYGGEWRHGRFAYNTAVVRVNTTIVHNTYINKTVINNVVINNNHTSFNGRGGIDVRPDKSEIIAAREHHLRPTAEQNSNQLQARNNPNQFPKFNGGRKPVFAGDKPMTYQPQQDNNQAKPSGWKAQPIANRPQGGAQPHKGFKPVEQGAGQPKPQVKPEGSFRPVQGNQKPGNQQQPVNQPVNPQHDQKQGNGGQPGNQPKPQQPVNQPVNPQHDQKPGNEGHPGNQPKPQQPVNQPQQPTNQPQPVNPQHDQKPVNPQPQQPVNQPKPQQPANPSHDQKPVNPQHQPVNQPRPQQPANQNGQGNKQGTTKPKQLPPPPKQQPQPQPAKQ